jgi:cyclopropane fatty-acyl-phospholipid synthase-like methyltransferase
MDYKTISNYYDYTLPFYKFFYHGNSNGIHYGFWDNSTTSHQESILNTNKFLAKTVGLNSDDIVLDAGCGIGGSANWIAKNYKANVIGITISDKQLQRAKKISAKEQTDNLVKFYNQDFLKTGFKDESFTVIWAIESVCHAENKKDFLKEAYRLLKSGGRIIVDDGFLLRSPGNRKEQEYLNEFLAGLTLSNLAYETRFKKSLFEVGFKNIKIYNKAKDIVPSAKKIYQMSIFSYPFSKITEMLGITSAILTKNNLAGIAQYHIIKNGLMGHRVFCAEK